MNTDNTINPETLLSYPTTFVDNGWIQVNVSLFAQPAPLPPFFPWESLKNALTQWRIDQLITYFFFVRKPPGLRLRFYSTGVNTKIRTKLVEWLLNAESHNDIRGFRFGIYEPEVFRFGGFYGMDVAHLLFQYDADIFLEHKSLGKTLIDPLPLPLFSLISSHDLIRKCVDDTAEMWDVWKQLEAVLKSVDDNSLGPEVSYPMNDIMANENFMNRQPLGVQKLISKILASNTQIASFIRAAQINSHMSVGVRTWLVAAMVFHWNRYGLTTFETRPMIAKMVQHLQP